MEPAPEQSWLTHPSRNPELLPAFQAFVRGIRKARVLEMGTKRSNPEVSTAHRDWCAPDAEFVGTDIEPGIDVNVAVDAHVLSSVFAPDMFDAVISVSVFEHLQRPWVAAKEIATILKPCGQAFIYTHFAFPIHGYPSDYWRFTRDALETIFSDAGLEIIGSDYENPARIQSEADPHTAGGEAYTGVRLLARKPHR